MKTSLFKPFGAVALVSLSVSLFTATTMASEFARGERHPGRSSHCSRLPRNARCVTHHGERFWYSGSSCYRIHPSGGYVLCERPVEVETIYVKRPVVERRVIRKTLVEEPVVEQEEVIVQKEETVYEEEEPTLIEEETVVEVLPSQCEVVIIGGERCWTYNGVYYRHCDGGYKVCHRDNHGHGHGHGHGDHGNGGNGHKPHGDHDNGGNGHKPSPTGNHGDHNGNGKGGHGQGNGGMNNGGHGQGNGHKPHQTGNGGMGNGHKPHQTGNGGHNNGGMGHHNGNSNGHDKKGHK